MVMGSARRRRYGVIRAAGNERSSARVDTIHECLDARRSKPPIDSCTYHCRMSAKRPIRPTECSSAAIVNMAATWQPPGSRRPTFRGPRRIPSGALHPCTLPAPCPLRTQPVGTKCQTQPLGTKCQVPHSPSNEPIRVAGTGHTNGWPVAGAVSRPTMADHAPRRSYIAPLAIHCRCCRSAACGLAVAA